MTVTDSRGLSETSDEPSTKPFLVVFTCVDHRSRSAIAEQVATRRIRDAGLADLEFVGAGGHMTRAGKGISEFTRAELTRLGLEPPDGPAQQLTSRHIDTADLVVTFEREHRTEVFQFSPRMLKHCFGLTELVAIGRSAPELRSLPRHERVWAASRLRHLGVSAPDVPDTWRKSAEAHRAAADMIATNIAELVEFLA